jgi:hypothetical protein
MSEAITVSLKRGMAGMIDEIHQGQQARGSTDAAQRR